jgi:hypothetical protein
MRHCCRLIAGGCLIAGLAMLAAPHRLHAQASAATTHPAATHWTMPRTPDGHPDLEGVWENNVATPLERPRQFADKPMLTEAELALLVQRARARFGADADATFGDAFYQALVTDTGPVGLGATGTYSQNWLPDRYFERRTSLIVDPADGRLPPMTTAATAALAATATQRGRRPESARDFSLTNRCISFGFPDLFAAYMSVYRIVQTPDAVALAMEKIHDTRVISLDNRPHVGSAIRQYLGDSRGRWEGDTLVVETTNFHPDGNPMGGLFNRASGQMTLIERFTRVADDTLEYTFTVNDPTVWTRPWTAMIPWKRASGDILEYACHEGNYSLSGMLSGARAEEAASSQAPLR